MVSDPEQIFQHDQDLPALIRANPVPALFSDSTHQIWQCETGEGRVFLKVCQQAQLTSSPFWQGMNTLFAVDLPRQIGAFNILYAEVGQASPLRIPELIKSASMTAHHPAYLVCKEVQGHHIESDRVMLRHCQQLAEHLAHLHQKRSNHGGSIVQPELEATQWPVRLQQTLTYLAAQQDIQGSKLDIILAQAADIQLDSFSLIMPDLRWDQFFGDQTGLTALLDLDAIVYGPRELEFILLEYVLTPQQAVVFSQYYQSIQAIPALNAVRVPYRLLLYLMNVLGSQDLDAWMAAPQYW